MPGVSEVVKIDANDAFVRKLFDVRDPCVGEVLSQVLGEGSRRCRGAFKFSFGSLGKVEPRAGRTGLDKEISAVRRPEIEHQSVLTELDGAANDGAKGNRL